MSWPTPPESSLVARDAEPPRLFGTDGIRMIVGREMTPPFVASVASALGTYLQGHGEVLVARDFRVSSEAMTRIFAGGLMMLGVHVRDMGPMPTPCLQFNIQAIGARMGVTITASHNPNEFNGIKFTGPEGLEIPPEAERQIERSIHLGQFLEGSWDQVGDLRSDGEGVDRYLRSILHHAGTDRIRKWNPLVVLDAGNGTSSVTSPALLRQLGCRVITLNASPDGHFPGRPSEPTEENLWALRKAVVEFGAQLGIAHDGDSDRVAFVDELGRFIPGESTMALFAQRRLQDRGGGTVVTSVTSSTVIEDVVRAEHGELRVTRSGSLPVAEGTRTHNAVFAGEENGGYYWPEHQVARDGPMSSARMIALLSESMRPLSALVDDLPQYSVLKTKVPLARADAPAVMAKVRAHLEDDADRLLAIDGVKGYFPDGWILIRPSGTEPICRVYAESRSKDAAKKLLDRGLGIVESARPTPSFDRQPAGSANGPGALSGAPALRR
ncbi:MAG TPA: phosphoglucosamine mutase [Thermoplasmata archaeon]|jgi:phosphomannomutase/phosphoglucomutase|nr:phosphoglucosamine mutase [Thermoplasmata archaeon]